MASYKVRILDDAINDFKRLDTLVIEVKFLKEDNS